MSVKVRPYCNGGWEVDIRIPLPDGTVVRDRKKAPGSSRNAALRWGESRERELLANGKPQRHKKEEVAQIPTLAGFAERFVEGYAKANRLKPSTIASKSSILRVHLVPALGDKRLDRITTEDVQLLKAKLEKRSAKTVNNVLTVLSVCLRTAVDWNLIERVPCALKLLKTSKSPARFLDFDEYERLIESARRDHQAHVIVVLAGDAGLRCGEIMALEWQHVDLRKRQLCVAQSEWKGHVTIPKSGRIRFVPLTKRLAEALQGERHLRGPRVVCDGEGRPLTQKVVQMAVNRAARRANVKPGVHILRHTFCSHLAMKGAPARAIQELAGHQDLSTTQRYMHLSPAALDAAIRLLEAGSSPADMAVEK